MPEVHLKQPGFNYSACGSFTKHHERIQKFRETDNLKHLYRNELDKACFAHDAGYSNSKDLTKRTISDKTLKDRAYEFARNCNYDGYQRALTSMFYMFLKMETESGVIVNEELTEELHKSVIKKLKKRKVYARFKDNIWAVDLAEMEWFSSKNKNVKYLLCFIDGFTKFAWVKPLKDKEGKTVPNVFIKIANESNSKPNNVWVDQGREFYNKFMQEWLCNNGILMYSTDNEGKPVIAESFVNELEAKIYKK